MKKERKYPAFFSLNQHQLGIVPRIPEKEKRKEKKHAFPPFHFISPLFSSFSPSL